MSVGLIGQRLAAIGTGICVGTVEFLWHTTVQKINMVVSKLEFKSKLEPGDGPPILPSEILDKQFSPMVVQAPIIEEMVFRGLFQPMLSYGIASCFPQLAASTLLGISRASLLSAVTTAVGFGLCHYPDYEKGGAFPATMGAIAGAVFGIVREKFGLLASIAAHMTTNLSTGLLDKYWPELLESSWERELRLLPPKERELRLLQEAIQRVDTAVAQMPQTNSNRVELEQLRLGWEKQIEALKVH